VIVNIIRMEGLEKARNGVVSLVSKTEMLHKKWRGTAYRVSQILFFYYCYFGAAALFQRYDKSKTKGPLDEKEEQRSTVFLWQLCFSLAISGGLMQFSTKNLQVFCLAVCQVVVFALYLVSMYALPLKSIDDLYKGHKAQFPVAGLYYFMVLAQEWYMRKQKREGISQLQAADKALQELAVKIAAREKETPVVVCEDCSKPAAATTTD